MKVLQQPPQAHSLISATRHIGYSFEAAVADLVDNSIAADAKTVDVDFEDSLNSYIAIIDDGDGMTADELFVEKSTYKCSWRLRERYKQVKNIYHCEQCGLDSWQGNPTPLEIHHLNGVNTDNRLENLLLLCPNCHA